jgi:YD repeat-containing protein
LRQEDHWNGSQNVTKAKYSFDNMQRVLSFLDALGKATSQTYDPWGRVKEVVDPSVNLYVNEYFLSFVMRSFFVAIANIANYRANPTTNTYKQNCVELWLPNIPTII